MGKLMQRFCGRFGEVRAKNRNARLIKGVENVDKFVERLAKQRPDLTNVKGMGYDVLLVKEKRRKVVALWGLQSLGCGQNPTEKCLENNATFCVSGL